MQLLDEVPMIWGSCYMLYCMHMVIIMLDLTFDETLSDVVQIQEKPGAVNKTVATFLTTYCVAFVTVYLMVPNPLIFQVNELNGNIYGTNCGHGCARPCTGWWWG